VLFLTGGNLSETRFTRDMVRRMHESGLVSVEAHTMSHVDLSTANRTRRRSEMADANTFIEEITGRAPVALAYPAGRFNDDVIETARDYYRFGLRHTGGVHNTSLSDFEIRRIRISRSTGMNAFINAVS
jgi:peptidoglycan/xylan/chitin deacetylase (PgdA/CDA1 family)